MNDVVRTILERRSVRRFQPCGIDEAIVREIIECGRCAPNAWGRQTFGFHAITDRKLMRELAELTAKYLGGAPEEHAFFSAPLIILISDIRENYMRLADAGCAMENMFLAAKSYGVGSVWINQFSPICDKLEVIDIPTGYTHNIENTGSGDAAVVMWVNEPFDPEHPDTIYLKV